MSRFKVRTRVPSCACDDVARLVNGANARIDESNKSRTEKIARIPHQHHSDDEKGFEYSVRIGVITTVEETLRFFDITL